MNRNVAPLKELDGVLRVTCDAHSISLACKNRVRSLYFALKKVLYSYARMRYHGVMIIARTEWIWSALAVAVGLLSAIVALHSDDLQFAVLFLFVECTVFGCARPERAWPWACLIAV